MNRQKNQTYPLTGNFPPTSLTPTAPQNTVRHSYSTNSFQRSTEALPFFSSMRPTDFRSGFCKYNSTTFPNSFQSSPPFQNPPSPRGQFYARDNNQEIPNSHLSRQCCVGCERLLQQFSSIDIKISSMNSTISNLSRQIKEVQDQMRKNVSVTSQPTRVHNNGSSSGKKKLSGKISNHEKKIKEIQEKLSEKLTGDDIYKFFRFFYDRTNLESLVSDLHRLNSDYQRVNRCFAELVKLGKESFNPKLIQKYFLDNRLLECAHVIGQLLADDGSSSKSDQHESVIHKQLLISERASLSLNQPCEISPSDSRSDILSQTLCS